MEYRKEIDGLRSLAVIPVIFYHAGFFGFGGGFVGVDIFFVISGYLITSIIISEKQEGTFSLARFYERRARRILPALFFVLLFCLLYAWVRLLPSEMKNFSQSLASTAAFVSNIFFWRSSGYFDQATALQPLIHTWSLSVEEQFYLLFPIFLMFSWKLGRRSIVISLVSITLLSLIAAQWGAHHRPAATFYLLPTRGWELCIGALAAFKTFNQVKTKGNQVLSILGLLLIAYSVFFFNKTTPFPSVYALVPTIGTALILLFCTKDTVVGKLLGSRPAVAVGLISYSAYLWHQPLFSIARHESLGEPSKLVFLFLVVATFVVAYFSWMYIENPFRKRDFLSRKQVALYAIICSFMFFGIGISGSVSNGFKGRLPPNIEWESLGEKLDALGDICSPLPLTDFPGVQACSFGDKKSARLVALYGDSHAQAISFELDSKFKDVQIHGIRVSIQGCNVIPLVFDSRNAKANDITYCKNSFDNLLRYLKLIDSDVVVATRWTYRLYPIPGEIETLNYDNKEGGVEWNEYREYVAVRNDGSVGVNSREKEMAVEHLLTSLQNLEKKLIIVYPVPEVGWDIAKVNLAYYRKHGVVLSDLNTSYSEYKNRNRFILKLFESHNWDNNTYFVKPEKLLCNTHKIDRCLAQYEGVPFYYDDDHLSAAGAKLVVEEILSNF